MPKLNLDIFSPTNATGRQEERTPPHDDEAKTEPESRKRVTLANESPRFVPVGFHARHLRLLDKAVFNLRERGHWKANKSALIRLLIDQNADRLESLYLSEDADKTQVGAPTKQQ